MRETSVLDECTRGACLGVRERRDECSALHPFRRDAVWYGAQFWLCPYRGTFPRVSPRGMRDPHIGVPSTTTQNAALQHRITGLHFVDGI